ncbi:Gfo/Idh/MocA family protein [Paludisphaera mucosa]|uniref:Gfo/Idh/MocA family oxidoreductase n=1 Tax=Paludisphaera mucosa TaxID=3030827 RepID=A0ABT6FEL2_9BACT|nr:Gfo/Idh/MocA family oxidoreductase [Paludisphaera mucosa]MDG3006018.1 Gfo/Idh/MocA family oxidoreductase [Paludisphaera mucosa]
MKAKRVTGGKVRYGIVAGGSISQGQFMPGVRNTKNSELTVLVTGDPEKADVLKEEFGLKNTYHYDDFDKLLTADEVDALYVATPNHLHTPYVVPALKAGIHVLLEKPMAVREEDCRAMIAAAQESGAKLMVAYRLHFEPATVAAVEQVRAGDVGDVRAFTSTFSQFLRPDNHRAKNGFDDGPVYDMGVYPINACRQFFGAEPIEVRAVASRNPEAGLGDLDDTVSVTLRFPNDGQAVFIASYGMHEFEHYSVVGSKGSLSVQPAYSYGHGLAYDVTIGDEKEHKSYPETDQFGGEAEYFSNCILNDLDPEPDGEEGWCDVRIVEAIRRALETGQPQTLEPYTRKGRIEPSQVMGLPPAQKFEMVNASDPSKNGD